MKPEIIALSQKLKAIRESKKVSQEYIARKIGISQAEYSKIESGKINVGDKLEDILSAMDLNIDSFNNVNPYGINIYNNKFEENSIANIINQFNSNNKIDDLINKLDLLIEILMKANK